MAVPLAAGLVVAGRYRLDARIGAGGMGDVWAATHVVTRKKLALKFLKVQPDDGPEVKQRFLREARAASAVRHPNVVQIHDVLELPDGPPVMVMDLLDGEPLAALLKRERTLPVERFAQLLLPVVSALGVAHERGVVHRDLKPDNIFLAKGAGGALDVKVLDFGIAKLTASEGDAVETSALTNTGSMLGTPSYMSPEQILGDKDVDHRTDIWSLGVIFYECLTGTRPTQGPTLGKVMQIILTGAIKPISTVAPSLPADLKALIGRMLSFARENRPEDLREVMEVLRAHTTLRVPTFERPSLRPLAPELEVLRVKAPALSPMILGGEAFVPKEAELPGVDAPSSTRATRRFDTPIGMATPRTGLRRPRRRGRAAMVLGGAAVAAALVAGIFVVRARSGSGSPRAAAAHVVPAGAGGRCAAGMVELTGGTFTMGATGGMEDEGPPHAMSVEGFCVDRTEVTVGAYNGCVGSGACTPAALTVQWGGVSEKLAHHESGACRGYDQESNDLPINCITWHQADAFCRATAKRLPTEIEWEYAARNGSADDAFPWGSAPLDPTRANLCDPECAASYTQAGFPRTPAFDRSDGFVSLAPVGSYPAGASKAGVLDLMGNVWEWTSSEFCRYPAHSCEPSGKVFRGGGWATHIAARARVTVRLNSLPEHRYADIGFRCVASPR